MQLFQQNQYSLWLSLRLYHLTILDYVKNISVNATKTDKTEILKSP